MEEGYLPKTISKNDLEGNLITTCGYSLVWSKDDDDDDNDDDDIAVD